MFGANLMKRKPNIVVCGCLFVIFSCSCARQHSGPPVNYHRIAIGRIQLGMRLDDLEQVVKVAGGTEADLEIMAAPGSNVTVRNYAFEPQTALSVGAQLRDGELIVTSLQVCRDANDKGKMYRHWQHVTELDVP